MTEPAPTTARGSGPADPVRLLCLPHAGAGASTYRGWQQGSDGRIRVHPVQLPGREERFAQRPFVSLPALVEQVCGELLALVAWERYALFGHSMGALIAFEMARELRRRGAADPLHLFVSGMVAPQARGEPEQLHLASDEVVLEYLRGLGGASGAFFQSPELQALMLPVIRADFAVVETYRYVPGAPLRCPISAWGGVDDPSTIPRGVAAWRDQTSGRFRLRMLPGDHFFPHAGGSSFLSQLNDDLLESAG